MPVFLGMSVTDCQLSLFIMRFQGFGFYTAMGFLFFLFFNMEAEALAADQ